MNEHIAKPIDMKLVLAEIRKIKKELKKDTRYERLFIMNVWCRLSESNQQPDDYKSTALPIELRRHLWWTL